MLTFVTNLALRVLKKPAWVQNLGRCTGWAEQQVRSAYRTFQADGMRNMAQLEPRSAVHVTRRDGKLDVRRDAVTKIRRGKVEEAKESDYLYFLSFSLARAILRCFFRFCLSTTLCVSYQRDERLATKLYSKKKYSPVHFILYAFVLKKEPNVCARSKISLLPLPVGEIQHSLLRGSQ